MMKSTLILVGVLAAAIVALGFLAAEAKNGQTGPAICPAHGEACCMRMGMGFDAKMAGELKLTAQQKSAIQKIREELMAATADHREHLASRMRELNRLWTADSIDIEAIKTVMAELDGTRTDIRDKAIDSAAEAIGVLTVPQRQKLNQMINKRGAICGCCACGCCAGCQGMGLGAPTPPKPIVPPAPVPKKR